MLQITISMLEHFVVTTAGRLISYHLMMDIQTSTYGMISTWLRGIPLEILL